MHFGYILSRTRGEAGLVLAALARDLARQNHRLIGAVELPAAEGLHPPMDIGLLPSGRVQRISQDLGPGSEGCRLNAGALELAVGQVQQDFETTGADLMLLSKFGKQEVEGRGFRQLIAEALAADLPVLVTVGEDCLIGFNDFAQGMAQPVACSLQAAQSWCHHALALPVEG
jgi:Protein of unknown function (DUF2478)